MSLAIGDRTTHLPLELTSFVGRRTELADAKRLLGTHRLVTVTGIGGVGKTRLALRVAADVAHTFTGGVRLVELGDVHDAGALVDTTLGCNGDDEAAATYLEEALVISYAHGESVNRALAHTALAVISEAGAPTRAADHLERALHLTRQLRSPVLAADLLHIAATLTADRHAERAAVLFEAAEAWQHHVGRIPTGATANRGDVHARTTLRLGEREHSQAQQRGRRFSLDQAMAYALGEQPDRDERCVRAGDLLTPREWQVAQLIRQGLTNKAIAKTLVISQRTAQGHVERILNKLGFTSRVHVAAWLTERDAVDPEAVLEVGFAGR